MKYAAVLLSLLAILAIWWLWPQPVAQEVSESPTASPVPESAVQQAAPTPPNTTAGRQTHVRIDLTVSVITQDDQPIPDAVVSVGGRTFVRSDQRGIALIQNATLEGRLTVVADGFVTYEMSYLVDEPRIVVRLMKGGGFFGTVTSDGAALADAQVMVSGDAGFRAETLTDASGYFTLDGLPLDSTYRLRVYASGHQTLFRTDLRLTQTQTRRELTLNLKPDRDAPAQLRGWVTDIEERPIAGALIALRNFINGEQAETLSDDAGFFQFEQAPSRAFVISADADGYSPASRFLSEKDTDLRLMLRAGTRIEGRVVDLEGRPLSDVRYTPVIGFRHRLDTRTATTDANGVFVIDDAGAQVSLRFEKEGYASRLFSLRQALKSGETPNVVMTATKPLVATVVDAQTDIPITQFTVTLKLIPPEFALVQARRQPLSIRHDQGQFTLPDLPQGGVVDLQIEAQGYAPRRFRDIPVDQTDTRLALSPQSNALRGGVRDQDGVPRADARVKLFGLADGATLADWLGDRPLDENLILFRRETHTDRDGRFRFDDLAGDARHALIVDEAGLVRTFREPVYPQADENEPELWITAEAAASVFGDIDRQAYPEAFAIKAGAAGKASQSLDLTSEQVSYDIDGLPSGKVLVALVGGDGRGGVTLLAQQEIVLTAGQPSRVDFRPEFYIIEGPATYDGTPMIEDALYLVQGFNWRKTRTDENGRFRFEDVKPDTYKLVAPWVDAPETLGQAHLLPDYPNQFLLEVRDHIDDRFDFRRMGDLIGILLFRDNEQPDAWRIMVRGQMTSGAPHQRDTAHDQGYFLFPGLPPGRYELGRYPDGNPADFERIIEGFIMPDDGSSLDLGELTPKGAGTLRVVLTGDQPVDWRFQLLIDHEGGETGPDIVRDLYHVPDQLLIDALPRGPVNIRVQAADSSAFRITPPSQTRQIDDFQFHEAIFTVTPITFVRIEFQAGGPRPVAVRMISPRGVVEGVAMDRPTDPEQSYLIFGPTGGEARGLLEGVYTLEAVADNGRQLQRRITLKAGRETQIRLIFP